MWWVQQLSKSRWQLLPCGYYPTSKCPPSCESGQTLTQISGKNYCVDNQNGMCYGIISYSSSQAKQKPDASCSPCGKYPASDCPPYCKTGIGNDDQALLTVGGKSFCVVKTSTGTGGACYKTMTSYNPNQYAFYNSGGPPCSCSCGYYASCDEEEKSCAKQYS